MRLAMPLLQKLPKHCHRGLTLPLCLLFARHLRFDSADPDWADRDRLVLAPALAPMAEALADLAGLPPGWCESHGLPLGAGLGMVLAERLLAARFGRSLVDHRAWVFATGADLATGPTQEAAMLAGLWRLGRLTLIASVSEPQAPGLAGFTASGWSVRRVDGAEAGDVAAAISAALRSQKPTLIACITAAEEAEAVPEPATEEGIPAWGATGRRNAGMRRGWLKRLARHSSRQDFENAMAGRLPAGWHTALVDAGPLLPPPQKTISTAETLRRALARLPPALPDLASLPGESAWKQPGGQTEFCHTREAAGRLAQGVSSAMAGMAMHGGLLPIAAHGLADIDNLRAGLRAAALGGLRLVECVVEPATPCPAAGQRAALRAMRNMLVFRPADASEALECAELALRRTNGPSVLLLSEVPVPLLAERPARTRCAKGGYVLQEAGAPRAVSLIASGPELHLAMQVRALLLEAGVPSAVISLPCWTFFARQEQTWQEAVLGDAPRVGLENGSGFGWDRWLGPNGLFIGPEEGEAAAIEAHRATTLILRHLGLPQTP